MRNHWFAAPPNDDAPIAQLAPNERLHSDSGVYVELYAQGATAGHRDVPARIAGKSIAFVTPDERDGIDLVELAELCDEVELFAFREATFNNLDLGAPIASIGAYLVIADLSGGFKAAFSRDAPIEPRPEDLDAREKWFRGRENSDP